MELNECVKCGEVQRDIYRECIACGGKGFRDEEVLILGETLKELYENWRHRNKFMAYDDGYENYLSSIESFLLDYSIGDEVAYIKDEVKDLRKYLKTFNANMKSIYEQEDKIAKHLLSIRDDEIFVNLTRGVLYLMEME